jgi:hypothetical protein
VSNLRPYQPYSGDEGMSFMARFCDECARMTEDGCEIQGRTMLYGIDSPHYPPEWVTDDERGPRCTAFARGGDGAEGGAA